MTGNSTTPYDLVPYRSHAYAGTHPARLATIGHLFGLHPASPGHCRVLDLGCGNGWNLIPMAWQLPGSRFLGLDAAAGQIAEGRADLEALGLGNLELRAGDLRDLPADSGLFDYILVHGVWSWVPEEVRRSILALIGRHLAPHGIAYVSYNTLPGWHLRGLVRDAMRWHSRHFAAPAEQIGQARAMLDFLAHAAAGREDAFGRLLASELEQIRRSHDFYIYHEHLSPENQPVRFADFAAAVTDAGLIYLGEARLPAMLGLDLPAEVRETIERISSDLVEMQQYLDFVRNTFFRSSLVVRPEVRLERHLTWHRLEDLCFGCSARPDEEGAEKDGPALLGEVPAAFRGPEAVVRTSDPLLSAALAVLGEVWPRCLSFGELRREAALRAGSQLLPGEVRESLGRSLVTGLARGFVEGVIEPWPAGSGSDRPLASPVARYSLARGHSSVASLRHEPVTVDGWSRAVLDLCDGTRDRQALAEALGERVRAELRARDDARGEGLVFDTGALADLCARRLAGLEAASLILAEDSPLAGRQAGSVVRSE